ncbi:hypothetical protein [Leucobacter chromiireducens]|nr:hypothetical protein [Leucobacter chromiireducens]
MDTTTQSSHQRISRMAFVLVPRVLALLCVLGAGTAMISGFARGAITGLASGPVLLALICLVAAFGIGIQPLGYTMVVRDDGDALLVGWRQRRIPISEISEVRFAAPKGGTGGTAHATVRWGGRGGGEFSYVPRDLRSGVLRPTEEPRSLADLRERAVSAKSVSGRVTEPRGEED